MIKLKTNKKLVKVKIIIIPIIKFEIVYYLN